MLVAVAVLNSAKGPGGPKIAQWIIEHGGSPSVKQCNKSANTSLMVTVGMK